MVCSLYAHYYSAHIALSTCTGWRPLPAWPPTSAGRLPGLKSLVYVRQGPCSRGRPYKQDNIIDLSCVLKRVYRCLVVLSQVAIILIALRATIDFIGLHKIGLNKTCGKRMIPGDLLQAIFSIIVVRPTISDAGNVETSLIHQRNGKRTCHGSLIICVTMEDDLVCLLCRISYPLFQYSLGR